MPTEINKDKELEVGAVRQVVGKASAEDAAKIKASFQNLVNTIKAVHIG